jgi:hypothetical protein
MRRTNQSRQKWRALKWSPHSDSERGQLRCGQLAGAQNRELKICTAKGQMVAVRNIVSLVGIVSANVDLHETSWA